MWKQWRIWLAFGLIFLVIIFSIMNNKLVKINFGFFVAEQPLILILFISIFLGAVLMFLFLMSAYWQKGEEVKQLKEEIIQLKTELSAKEQYIQEQLDILVSSEQTHDIQKNKQ